MQEKKHHGEDPAPDAVETPQPGKKPELLKHDEHEDPATARETAAADAAEATGKAVDDAGAS